MPSLQLSRDKVVRFEQIFMQEVQQRSNQRVSSVRQAFFIYLSLNEQRRQRFWEKVSGHTELSRERIYKFFRFTWSRQFYTSIAGYRESIKQLVVMVLDELGLRRKTVEVNAIVWNRVWAVFKGYNLHYDGTDQFVRNCVNLYFSRLEKGRPLKSSGTLSLPPHPDGAQEPVNISVVEEVCEQPAQDEPKQLQFQDLYDYFGNSEVSSRPLSVQYEEADSLYIPEDRWSPEARHNLATPVSNDLEFVMLEELECSYLCE